MRIASTLVLLSAVALDLGGCRKAEHSPPDPTATAPSAPVVAGKRKVLPEGVTTWRDLMVRGRKWGSSVKILVDLEGCGREELLRVFGRPDEIQTFADGQQRKNRLKGSILQELLDGVDYDTVYLYRDKASGYCCYLKRDIILAAYAVWSDY